MKTLMINKKLNLKNKGNLELVFLGTGTPFTKTLFNNNFILIKGNTHILVDFGQSGPVALKELTGLKPTDIEVILPTHSHTDHIGGLEYLALFNRYIAMNKSKPKLKMIITEKYQNILWERSLRGGLEWNELIGNQKKMTFNDYFEPIRPVKIRNNSRDIFEIDFEEIHLEIYGTNHIPDKAKTQKQAFTSYGLFVDNSLMISCDTKFDSDLIELYAHRSDYIFHDCSFFPNPVHASIQELRTLPQDIKKKMFLMHYSDNWAEQDIKQFAGLAKQGIRYIF